MWVGKGSAKVTWKIGANSKVLRRKTVGDKGKNLRTNDADVEKLVCKWLNGVTALIGLGFPQE